MHRSEADRTSFIWHRGVKNLMNEFSDVFDGLGLFPGEHQFLLTYTHQKDCQALRDNVTGKYLKQGTFDCRS